MDDNVYSLLGIKSATILTLTTICFNGSLLQVPFRYFSSKDEMIPLVRSLLDHGVHVDTYWANIDYAALLDPRLPAGYRR